MGNLLLDASSPASQWTTANQTNTTATFSPPANSLLVAWLRHNTGNGNTPTDPSITDSLGTHLTWTLIAYNRRPEIASGADSAIAVWAAPCPSSQTNMTVSTTHTDAATGSALKVHVWTDDSGALPATGAFVENATTSIITSISQNFTATVTGSRGCLGYVDWDAAGAATAGTGCTVTGGDAVDQGATLSYALAMRTTADGVSGVTTTMALTVPSGGSGGRRWIALEVTPNPDAPPTTPGTPSISNITTTTADATWTASSDDVGVSFYEIVVEPD